MFTMKICVGNAAKKSICLKAFIGILFARNVARICIAVKDANFILREVILIAAKVSKIWSKKRIARISASILWREKIPSRQTKSIRKKKRTKNGRLAPLLTRFFLERICEEFMAVDFAFLDSGTGGIPYMLLLKEKSPQSTCVYLGDTIHFPYGEKSIQQVTESASIAIKSMVQKWNPRCIVIACNTISVTALDNLRTLFPHLPIVGTVPAVRLAAKVTRNKKIGLLATNATISHPYCKKLIEDHAKDCQVFERGDPDLVAFIEHRLFTANNDEKLAAVFPAVDFFCERDCDTIILGCTHFTHLAREIEDSFAQKSWKKIFVVDSREGVSKQALRVLPGISAEQRNEGARESLSFPDMSFFVTELKGDADKRQYESFCKNFRIPFGGLI